MAFVTSFCINYTHKCGQWARQLWHNVINPSINSKYTKYPVARCNRIVKWAHRLVTSLNMVGFYIQSASEKIQYIRLFIYTNKCWTMVHMSMSCIVCDFGRRAHIDRSTLKFPIPQFQSHETFSLLEVEPFKAWPDARTLFSFINVSSPDPGLSYNGNLLECEHSVTQQLLVLGRMLKMLSRIKKAPTGVKWHTTLVVLRGIFHANQYKPCKIWMEQCLAGWVQKIKSRLVLLQRLFWTLMVLHYISV